MKLKLYINLKTKFGFIKKTQFNKVIDAIIKALLNGISCKNTQPDKRLKYINFTNLM